MVEITGIEKNSYAAKAHIVAGDILVSINGNPITDVLDYRFYITEKKLDITLDRRGETVSVTIKKPQYDDIGLEFATYLMDKKHSCKNKCVFCFIDQNPKGMREDIYFKDDDSRLSFLFGNYITLTNLSEHEVERIISMHISPVNISVHTTNPALRCQMMNNRFAGDTLTILERFAAAGIRINCQLVLCPGINDGKELDRTIQDLTKYIPCMESVSVVPVGLSKFRQGLYPLQAVDRESAQAALEIIEGWQKRIYQEHGIHFIHASDEFYILAERELPESGRYDGFPQLENGVGMLRLLDTEVQEALHMVEEEFEGEAEPERISIATGLLAAPYLEKQADRIMKQYPQVEIKIFPIRNEFFGEQITVAGLITGQDLVKQLSGQDLGDRLLLPVCMFRSGEETFLDDMTREQVQNALQVPIHIVKSSGQDLVGAVLGLELEEDTEYEGYELKEI